MVKHWLNIGLKYWLNIGLYWLAFIRGQYIGALPKKGGFEFAKLRGKPLKMAGVFLKGRG